MKKTVSVVLSIVLLLLVFAGCQKPVDRDALWQQAKYSEDTSFGSGAKTIFVKVTAGEKSVTFTLHTDDVILSDALLRVELVEGEDSVYGLYVKKVNGISADWDVDQSYWSFYQNGEYMLVGVSATEVRDGDSFEIIYTK